MGADTGPVALLPWGLVLEDFLDMIGLTVDDFCDRFTGSWLFGYAEALGRAGKGCVLVCYTLSVRETQWRVHRPSGTPIVLLPAGRLVRLLRDRTSLYQRTIGRRPAGPGAWLRAVIRDLAAYGATRVLPLARVLRSARCSAVLVQEYEFPRFDVCVALGRFLRLPVVGVFQGGDYQRWRTEEFFRHWSLRSARALIVGPATERQRLGNVYGLPPGRLADIPNPVDLDAWQPGDRANARRQLDLPDEDLVVAWHGRVSMQKKGLDVLVEAWCQVPRLLDGRRVHLLLIGDGEDGPALNAMLQERGTRNVRWVREFVHAPTEIAKMLSAADVYVFPSRHEGFPVALAEALACGLPAVASAATGVVDIVGTDGRGAPAITVPTADAEALARALAGILADDDDRRNRAAAARARASELSLDVVGRRLDELLRDRAPAEIAM